MSTPAAPPRPSQVTIAAWVVIIGSVAIVLGAFGTMSGLTSLATRASIETFLDEPPANALDLGFERAREILRVVTIASGAMAAAAAVLGVHVLKRNRGARIGLAVLALPIFVTSTFTSGFAAAVVAAACLLLWLEPARSWFAGRPIPERFLQAPGGRERSEGGGDARRDADRPAPDRPAPDRPAGPVDPGAVAPGAAPYAGFGAPGGARTATLETPGAHRPDGAARPGPSRPPALLFACVATWVTTGLVVAMLLASVVTVLASPETLLEEARRSNPSVVDAGITAQMLQTATIGFAAVLMVWALVAVAMAVLAFRGVAWARVTLAVFAGIVAAVSLPAALVAPPAIVVTLSAAAVLAALIREDVRRWAPGRGEMAR